jgi:hypothetical protein
MKHLPHTKIKTDKLLKCYVSKQDYDNILDDFESSDYPSLSAYLRRRLLGRGIMIRQPKALLTKLDSVGTAIDRIGNNVNQIAKKVHLTALEGRLSAQIISEFNKIMSEYNEYALALSKAYRTLLRNMF